MYNLSHFKAENYNEVLAFIHAHPFITLCGCDKDNKPVATHIPVLIEEREEKIFLQAHVMRKQKHSQKDRHSQGPIPYNNSLHLRKEKLRRL